MRHTKSFSLNDSYEIQEAILDRLAQEPAISPVVIQALYHWYFEPHDTEQAPTDNAEVLQAIADLRRELRTLIEQEPRQRPQDVERRDADEEAIEEDLELDDTFIADLRRVASGRPGMRMES